MTQTKSEISVIIPAYNEEKNVSILYHQLKKILDSLNKKYEIIFIDDGSIDNTFENLKRLHHQDKDVKIIKFRKNFGQTAAMDAGFKFASGNIVVAMDSDLQNDPQDIPRMINLLEKKNLDCISGWRKFRKDSFTKNLLSRGASLFRKFLLNDKIHDSGCSLKVYKKECLQELDLYGEMHRFIPALLQIKGFKVGEMVVKHHSRKYGQTKYTFKRVLKGFLDVINVWFWQKFSHRPLHLFGSIGFFIFSLGFLISLYLTISKLFFKKSIGDRPLLLLGALSLILGVQFFIFGVLADVLTKLYYKERKNYQIENIIN